MVRPYREYVPPNNESRPSASPTQYRHAVAVALHDRRPHGDRDCVRPLPEQRASRADDRSRRCPSAKRNRVSTGLREPHPVFPPPSLENLMARILRRIGMIALSVIIAVVSFAAIVVAGIVQSGQPSSAATSPAEPVLTTAQHLTAPAGVETCSSSPWCSGSQAPTPPTPWLPTKC